MFKFIHNSKKGTSMVEMLAVMSVILILLGTFASNTIRTRSMGDIAMMRTQAASIELAMQKRALKNDSNIESEWRTLSINNPEGSANRNKLLYDFLLPTLSRPISFSVFGKTFAGYNLIFPNELRIRNGIRVRVTDPNNVEVYPNMPDMN